MAIAAAAAIERHPHLAEHTPAGFVRVDMHSHTMFSGDSTTTLDEIAESVIEAGIDVLCVTDHNAIEGALRLQRALEGDGVCRVVVGEEVRTHTGETARQIRSQGALVYIPHPFDPMRRNLTEASLEEITAAGLVDAIEVHNSKTSLQSLNARALGFGVEHALGLGAGSDAHVPHALGSAFVEMPDFDGPTEFLSKLREGRIVGHHWDKARPWSARIIPSVTDDY